MNIWIDKYRWIFSLIIIDFLYCRNHVMCTAMKALQTRPGTIYQFQHSCTRCRFTPIWKMLEKKSFLKTQSTIVLLTVLWSSNLGHFSLQPLLQWTRSRVKLLREKTGERDSLFDLMVWVPAHLGNADALFSSFWGSWVHPYWSDCAASNGKRSM